MTVTYPLDLSGVSQTNLVNSEVHTTTEAHFRDYFFIIPNLAPFFVDNFKLRLKTGDVTRTLVEDVDFSFALPYVTGTRTTGKQMYGAVTLHNLQMNGILSTDYQTVGGDQIADRLYVLSYLADKAYNPRTTIWDVITNVPNAMPPTPHYQDYNSFFGQEELVTKLAEIRDAILSNSSFTSETIRNFLSSYNNERGGFVMKAGDTMSGPLSLVGLPSESQHAASKRYVDERLADISSVANLLSQYVKDTDFHLNMDLKLNLTGGVLTGPLSLNSDPIQDDQAVTKRYVDQSVSTLANQLADLQQAVTQLVNSNFATKAYVDDITGEISVRFSTHK